MSVTKLNCPVCKKPWIQKTASRFGKSKMITGVCGHILNERQIVDLSSWTQASRFEVAEAFKLACWDLLQELETGEVAEIINPLIFNPKAPESIVSVDGYKLFPYQCEAVRLGESANFRCLFEYQMGLGKTPIMDASFLLHPQELLPALIVCGGNTKWQHFKELIRWNGGKHALKSGKPIEWVSQVIGTSEDGIMPYFKTYVITYDMLKRFDVEDFRELNLKTVVLDECQKIKNTTSKRSVALRELLEQLEIKHVIALSGTPIKNNPLEFFSILNILAPHIFRSKKQFAKDWIAVRWDKRKQKFVMGGIKNIERFHKITKGFIFRKTREEVKDQTGMKVTEAFRDFKYLDIDTDIKKAYKKAEDDFSNFFTQHELEGSKYTFKDYSHILALFAKMRHLTGLSKVSWGEEFISDWLSSRCLTVEELIANEDLPEKERKLEPKLAIFTHHVDVAEYLMNCIRNICEVEGYDWKPLYLPSGLTSEKQDDIQMQFNFGNSRILVASTLGSGEGINLQHNCHDAVMMERQWNPANEEQAESRFIRIGQDADIVTVTYPTVLGTIEEYFLELVESKRHTLKEIRSGKKSAIQWDEQETVMQLASMIIQKRKGQRWSY